MASAAEQLASNISLASFAKATELKRRLWFTLGALVLFRLLSFVPMPGIDPHAMASLYQTQSGGVLDFFNTFSGGCARAHVVVALGVMPYITASIVVQLGGYALRAWAALKKEGETGRKKLNQYTRYLTVAADHGAGLFHRRRPRRAGARRRASPRSSNRACCSASRRPSASSAAPVPDVDRRADHQPRHRQRRVADHHGRHRRPMPRALASCSKAAAPARWIPVVVFGHRDRRSCWCCSSASWSGRSAGC